MADLVAVGQPADIVEPVHESPELVRDGVAASNPLNLPIHKRISRRSEENRVRLTPVPNPIVPLTLGILPGILWQLFANTVVVQCGYGPKTIGPDS